MTNRDIMHEIAYYISTTVLIYLVLNGFSLSLNMVNLITSALASLILDKVLKFVYDNWLWKKHIFQEFV